jgi:hypothetical protein
MAMNLLLFLLGLLIGVLSFAVGGVPASLRVVGVIAAIVVLVLAFKTKKGGTDRISIVGL